MQLWLDLPESWKLRGRRNMDLPTGIELDSSKYLLILHAMKLIDAPLEHYSLGFRVSETMKALCLDNRRSFLLYPSTTVARSDRLSLTLTCSTWSHWRQSQYFISCSSSGKLTDVLLEPEKLDFWRSWTMEAWWLGHSRLLSPFQSIAAVESDWVGLTQTFSTWFHH